MRKYIALPFGVLFVIPYIFWLVIRFGLKDADEILKNQVETLKQYKVKH